MKKRQRQEIICRCNNISREEIENCIRAGAKTLNEIFDQTTAGVGPCGGSCRRKLKPLLDHYLINNSFPDKIISERPDTSAPCDDKSKKSNPNEV